MAWSYSYLNAVAKPCGNFGDYSYTKVTATGPNGYSMAYDINSAAGCAPSLNLVDRSTDALGREATALGAAGSAGRAVASWSPLAGSLRRPPR